MSEVALDIATAIASGAGGSLGASSASAISRLVSALREKLRGNPAARRTLDTAVDPPVDPAAREDLRALLGELIAQDADFGTWLGNLWAEIAQELHADASKSVNSVSGTVLGNVVQARDVHGGINIGRKFQLRLAHLPL